jgi:hypothetical protein
MSRQSDKKTTKQVRIDAGWHKLVKVEAAKAGRTIREVLEEALSQYLVIENEQNQ